MIVGTPIFKLKDKNPENKSLNYLIIYHNKERFKYSTGLLIRPHLWNNTENRPQTKNDQGGQNH